MSDLISRQAAIELIRIMYPNPPIMRKNRERWKEKYEPYIQIEKALEWLPSAQPEQRWIRCSERLPEGIGTYMTTLDYGKNGLAVGQRYYHGTMLGWEDDCVIAWMPLPEPYTADMRGEE